MKKKLIGWLIVFTVVMFLLPWFAITFAKSDAGMAIVLLLFFVINPICSFLAGFFAGKNIKKMWCLPVIAAMMFLLGAWILFDMGEIAFAIYAGIYLIIGIATMLVSALINKRSQP